jgi:hypothetical protein
MGSSPSEGEDRSTTRAVPEGLSCSSTDVRGRQEDTSVRDPGGDGVPDVAGGGVLASLAIGLPSTEGSVLA